MKIVIFFGIILIPIFLIFLSMVYEELSGLSASILYLQLVLLWTLFITILWFTFDSELIINMYKTVIGVMI